MIEWRESYFVDNDQLVAADLLDGFVDGVVGHGAVLTRAVLGSAARTRTSTAFCGSTFPKVSQWPTVASQI